MRRVFLLAACLLVTACGDPMRNVETLAEQDISEDAPTLDAVALPRSEADGSAQDGTGGGLFASLLGGSGTDDESAATPLPPDDPAADSAVTAPPVTKAGADGTGADGATRVAGAEPTTQGTPETDARPRKRRGLFGLLAAPREDPDHDVKVAALVEPEDGAAEGGEATLQQASLVPDQPATDAAQSDATPQPTAKAGFLGLFSASTPAVSASAPKSEVAPGMTLPYGTVARVCGMAKREMGKEIARFPEKRPVHRLYDSAPGNTAPHTLYLTGFGDGCARQFTASLAVFGSVGMHEQLRYGLPAEVMPYSDTDKAYETLKQKVCRVPKRKPCGSKISTMERDTVFVSIYERFDGNAHWSNLLLHDGKVLAQDHKAGG